MKAKVSSVSAIICLITLVFFCILACDNGSAPDSSSSKTSGLTKVCLTIEEKTSGIIQKSISAGTAWDTYKFYYNAVPKWTNATVQGKTNGWTYIDYFDGMSLGFFAPGQWTFNIQIMDENDDVVYQGYSDVSISNSSVDINVLVSNIGSVIISITAPTVDGDGLSISYSGTGSGGPVSAAATRENGITTFEYAFSDQSALDAGSYVFTLKHTVNSIADDSGAALAINLRPGEEVQITGHLENGDWQLSYIVVKIYSITINTDYENPDTHEITSNCIVKTNVTSAAAGERVSFYVNPFQGTRKEEVSYTWSGGTVDLQPSNGLYSFIMPEGDVTINAIYSGAGGAIDIGFFRAFFQMLYSSNPTAVSFGRSQNAPEHSGYYQIKDVILWCEEDNEHNKRIWWYNEPNTFKFKPGSLAELFKNCTSFTSIDLSGIDTSAVNNMSEMFANCTNLENVTFDEKENGNFKHFNTSNVSDMSSMFEGCLNLSSLDLAGLNTHAVTSMSEMFKGCAGLTELDLTGLDTSSVTSMFEMFRNCEGLTELTIAGLDTSSVTNMSGMFRGCESLTELVLDTERVWDVDENNPRYGKFRHFNTASVTDMSYMFCSKTYENENGSNEPSYMSLATLDVSGLDTSSVSNMSYMFYMCWQLSTLNVSGFKTSYVTDMSFMFACYNWGSTNKPGSLTSLNMSGWEFDNVTTVFHMFDRQENLANFDFPDTTNFASLTTMSFMFSHCLALTPQEFTDIVATWTFPAAAYEKISTSLFGNTETDRNKGGNYIFRDSMTKTSNSDPRCGKFATRQSFATKDEGKALWIGGSSGNAVQKGRLSVYATGIPE